MSVSNTGPTFYWGQNCLQSLSVEHTGMLRDQIELGIACDNSHEMSSPCTDPERGGGGGRESRPP